MKDNRNHFEKAQILSLADVGFEFEFFSNLTKGRTSEALSEVLGKKIEVSNKYHSDKPVSRDLFKIEPDYSGGANMLELITGPMSYNEAVPVMIKILKWIDENGWTDDKCAFQFSVSFDKTRSNMKNPIETMDKLKFILGIDENLIYSKFENRTKNVYAKSIKRVLPKSRYMILENINSIDPMMFKVPSDKYYGVNFTKAPKGYLEFRYLGGKDYQKKIEAIREVMDYVILYLYDIVSNRMPGYSAEDLEKLKGMMKNYANVVKCFSKPELFLRYYPDFKIFIDLKGFDGNLRTYFPVIRDKVFDLVIEGGITDCFFNYDTSTGRFQLKGARSRNSFEIYDFDVTECDIKGSNLKRCNIYDSKINKSNLEDCYIVRGTDVSNSRIELCSVENTNKLKDCYINCTDKTLNCEIDGGIIRAGILGEYSEVSDRTKKVKGFEEIRNERFISTKRLNDLNDKYRRAKFGDMNY